MVDRGGGEAGARTGSERDCAETENQRPVWNMNPTAARRRLLGETGWEYSPGQVPLKMRCKHGVTGSRLFRLQPTRSSGTVRRMATRPRTAAHVAIAPVTTFLHTDM